MNNKSYSNYKYWYSSPKKEKLDVKDLKLSTLKGQKFFKRQEKTKQKFLPKDQSSVENIKTKCKPQVYWTALGTTSKFSSKMGKEEKEKHIIHAKYYC